MGGNETDSSVGSVDDPKVVKKGTSNNKKRGAVDESDGNNKPGSFEKNKKPKRERDADGNEMIPLGKQRFVTVREFRGKKFIDIREHYEKDGKLLPGKKGISLSREQYTDLKGVLGEIDELIENAQ